MTTAIFFLLVGCADLRQVDGGGDRSRGSLSTISLAEFEYVGPGSMGRFVDYDRHPTWTDVLVAGADVGGVYLSADAGATWTNVTRDLPSTGGWAVRLVVQRDGTTETTRVVVGSDSGLFYSDDIDSTDGIDADELTGWHESSGLDAGDELPSSAAMAKLAPFHGSQHALQVGTLAVSASDPDIVWAGSIANAQVNLAQSPKDPASLQRFDRWKLFRSTDGGLSFTPALRFSEPISAFVATPYDSAGSVFTILVDPSDADQVWVATDRGLYRTENGATTDDLDADGLPDLVWSEVGTPDARSTTDLGVSWTAGTAACSDYADDPGAGAWCLPIQDTARVKFAIDSTTGWPAPGYEDHPNIRGLSLSTVDGALRLFLTVWDRGHADDAPADCSSLVDGDSFVDSALEHYRGGVYASDDGGETWSWLYTSNGAPGTDPSATPYLDDRVYRCDSHTSERNSDGTVSFMGDVETPEDDSAGFLLLAGGLGAGAGIYAYDPSSSAPWTWLTDSTATDWADRFEGGAELGIVGTAAAEVSRLMVDWDSRTDGYPEVYFGHRGILHGSWDTADARYEFVHLGSDYEGMDGDMTLWTGTGLDDTVTWDVVSDGTYTYLGVSDGGLFRVEEVAGELVYANLGYEAWMPNWSAEPDDLRKDEVRALAFDEESGMVYAGGFVTSLAYSNYIFMGAADSWTIIGGYGYTSIEAEKGTLDADHMNGLYTGSPLFRMEFNRLEAIPASHGLDTDLLAATTDGIWAWDAEATAGAQWQQLCPSLTDGQDIADLVYDGELVSGWAFAIDEDVRSEGLLAINLADLSCDQLIVTSYYEYGTTTLTTGKDPIRYGTAVGLAADPVSGAARLLVGGALNSYPSLFSGEVSCDATACTIGHWDYPWSGKGYYTAGTSLDSAMKRHDVRAIETYPLDKSVVGVAIGTTPGTDDYNPEILIWSEDGGSTAVDVDLAADDHGLPNRGLNRLRFSDDGAWLYATSSSSLYRMPVGW